MRQIDADALKEELELKYKIEYENNYKRESPPDNDGKLRLDVVEKVIDNAPTVNEWMPVSKAMPPEHEEVYNTERGETVMESDLVTVTALDNNGERYTGYGYTLDGEFGFGDPIIAWMPMPEPYEGEK